MSKYRLGYKENGEIKVIDLSKVYSLADKGPKELTDISIIDLFTSSFVSKQAMLDFLKKNNFIKENINDIFIVKDKKDKLTKKTFYKKIYMGDFLFYQNDKELLDENYLASLILSNHMNGDLIGEIGRNYYKKYNSTENTPVGINAVLQTMIRVSDIIKQGGYYNLPPHEKNEYMECLRDFITFELYKYEYDYRSERFLKKLNKDRDYSPNNINKRTFGVFIKKYFLEKNKELEPTKPEIKHEIDYDDDHEEFLTMDDFYVANNEILSTYEEDKEGPIIEGHDIIKPLSKKALEKSLNDIAEELVNPGYKHH